MTLPTYTHQTPFFSFGGLCRQALHWTPRTCVAGAAGFYSLGLAYEKGVMAAIDRIAIQLLRHHVGYIGLGAIMPTFQWYSAWGVRLTAALMAGITYDIAERTILLSIHYFNPNPQDTLPPLPERRSLSASSLSKTKSVAR